MAPQLTLSLQFGARCRRHRAVLPRHRSRWIRHALAMDAEITVRIVGAEEGQQLNRDYRHKDYATNVLTFDYQQSRWCRRPGAVRPGGRARGAEQNKTLEEHYAHLLVHGTLHAQGWDHETSEEDAREMEAYETAIMEELGFADPHGSPVAWVSGNRWWPGEVVKAQPKRPPPTTAAPLSTFYRPMLDTASCLPRLRRWRPQRRRRRRQLSDAASLGLLACRRWWPMPPELPRCCRAIWRAPGAFARTWRRCQGCRCARWCCCRSSADRPGAALLLVTPDATQDHPWLLLAATACSRLARSCASGRRRRPVCQRAVEGGLGMLAVAAYGGYFNGGLGILLLALFGLAGQTQLNAMNGMKNLVSALLTPPSPWPSCRRRIVQWRQALIMMIAATPGRLLGRPRGAPPTAPALRWGIVATGLVAGLFSGSSSLPNKNRPSAPIHN